MPSSSLRAAWMEGHLTYHSYLCTHTGAWSLARRGVSLIVTFPILRHLKVITPQMLVSAAGVVEDFS